MRNRIACAAVAVILAGCQTSYIGDESSPFYVVPPGSRITLNRALAIPPEQLGVFIQYGEVRPLSQVQLYYPYCRFELRTLHNAARTVAPDQMIVRRSAQVTLRAMYAAVVGERYAGVGMRVATDQGDKHDDGQPLLTFATRMDLHSEKQPDVFRLTCAQAGYRGEDRHVTIAEMKSTLGNLFTLDIAGPQK